MERLIGLVVLIGLIAGCSPKQPVPVRVRYVETDIPSSEQCVEITGAFRGQSCQLKMACLRNGKVDYKVLNETLSQKVPLGPLPFRAPSTVERPQSYLLFAPKL